AAPDRVEEQHEPDEKPERNGARLIPGPGSKCKHGADRQHAPDADHDPRATEADEREDERQREHDDPADEPGHTRRYIGVSAPRAESRASSQTPRASSSCESVMTSGTRTRMQLE